MYHFDLISLCYNSSSERNCSILSFPSTVFLTVTFSISILSTVNLCIDTSESTIQLSKILIVFYFHIRIYKYILKLHQPTFVLHTELGNYILSQYHHPRIPLGGNFSNLVTGLVILMSSFT
jgi:hypothetical protein